VAVLSLLKSFNLEHETRLIHGLTGLDISQKDLQEIGRDIATLERRFNLRYTGGKMEDMLPDMFFNKKGETGLTRENFETMRQEYYRAMGWDENGIPD
jgi:aldehyde:ferredoxin oxidoreductase